MKERNKEIQEKYNFLLTQLKKARKESYLKQAVIAKMIGRYSSYISKIESGDRRIDVIELNELAEVYNKKLSYFLLK